MTYKCYVTIANGSRDMRMANTVVGQTRSRSIKSLSLQRAGLGR
jgi:hypothetical protein